MPTPSAVRLTDLQRRQLAAARGNMAQAELARRVGLTSQAVNQIERGRKDPSFATLCKLAEALGFEVALRLQRKR